MDVASLEASSSQLSGDGDLEASPSTAAAVLVGASPVLGHIQEFQLLPREGNILISANVP